MNPAAVLGVLVQADVGGASAKLSQFNRQYNQVENSTRRGIKAQLSGNFDQRGFNTYSRAVGDASKRSVKKAELGANVQTGGFNNYSNALGTARRNTDSHVNGMKQSFGGLTGAIRGLAGALGVIGAAFVAYQVAKDAVKTTIDLYASTVKVTAATGMDMKTASRWIEVMKIRGVEANALTMGFVTLEKNMRNAAGGSSTAMKAFQQLGVPMKDIKSQDLQAVILDIADAYQKSNNPVERAAIAQQLFGRNAKTLMPVLAQGRQGIEQMLGAAGKLGAEIGPNQSQKFKEARLATFGFKLALDGLKITFTTAILPILTRVMMGLVGFIAKVREGTGVGAPLHYALLGIAWAANLVGKAISWVSKQFESGKPGATGLGSVLQWLANAARNVASAMVAAAKWISGAWNDLAQWFNSNLMPIFRGIASVLGPVFSTVFSALSTIIGGFVSVASALFTNILLPVFRAIATVVSTYVYPVLSAAFTAIKWLAVNVLLPVFQGLAWIAQNVLLPVFTFVFNAIKTVVLAAISVIGWVLNNVLIPALTAPAWVLNNVIVPAFTFVFNIVKTIVTGVASGIGAIVSGIATAATAVWAAVSAIFNTILAVIRGAWSAIWSAAVFVFNAIGSALSTAWTAIWTSLTWVWNTVVGVIRSVWNAVWSAATFVWNAISSALSAAWSAIWSGITWVFNQVVGIIRSVWNAIWSAAVFVFKAISAGISAAWATIWNAINWVGQNIVKGISGFFNAIYNAGKFLAGGFADGFKAVANTIIDVVWAVMGAVVTVLNLILKPLGVNGGKGIVMPGKPTLGGGGGKGGATAQDVQKAGFAQGGVVAAKGKGGQITAPLIMMGEEAPRHPEWVIPTNPAYRDRARQLHAAAGQALGLAPGGVAFSGKVSYFSGQGTAYGKNADTDPGISLRIPGTDALDQRNRDLMGRVFKVSIPGGRPANLMDIDLGPASWTDRNIDVTTPALPYLGFTTSNFPTDAVGKVEEVGKGGGLLATVVGVVKSIMEAVIPGLGTFNSAADLVKKGGELLMNLPLVKTLPKIAGVFGPLPGFIVGKSKELIDKAGKDLFKKKAKPVQAGGVGGGMFDLGVNAGSWGQIADMGHYLGLSMTSGYRPGDPGGSWHAAGRAQDWSNGTSTPQELTFAIWLAKTYGSRLLELIHAPLGWGIKDGKRVGGADFWGAATWSQHYNHVHVALAKGGRIGSTGLAIVGEGGPELVSLPIGSRVYSNTRSRSMIGQAASMGIPGYQGGTGGGGTSATGMAGSPFNWGAGGGPGPAWTGFVTPAYTSALDQMLGMPALPQTPAGWGLHERGSKTAQRFVDQALSTIAGFSTRIETLDHQSSTLQSYFTAIQEDLVDPTTGEINQNALQRRLQQMDQLIRISQEIFDLWSQIVAWYYQVLEIYDEILIWNAQFNLNWWNANPKAGGKNRKTNMDNVKSALSNYQSARADIAGKLGEATGSRQEAWIKIIQATADRADVAATKPNVQASQTGTTTGTDQKTQQLLDLANQQAQTLSQRLAVSQSQYSTIAGFTMPGLATGGIIGKAGWAMVGEQGPEPVYLGTGATVYSNQTPPVTTNVRVVVEDNRTPRVFVDDIEQAVDTVTRRTARTVGRKLPGSGGY